MSNLCRRCNVQINEGNAHCPLCGSYVQKAEQNKLSYPWGLREKTITGNVLGFFFSLSVLGILVCGVTDYLISKRLMWSLYVLVSVALLWLIMILPIARKWSFRRMMAIDVISVSAFICLVGLLSNGLFWSLSIVTPTLIYGSVAILGIVMITNRRIAKSFGFVLFINCLVGLCPLIFNEIFFATDPRFMSWPSQVCFITCSVILITYCICNWKNIKITLKKIFHIKGY